MIHDIKARIRSILLADCDYLNMPDVTPQNIDANLPMGLLFTGAFNNPFASGTDVKADIPIELYVYLFPIGTNSPSAEFQTDAILEDVLTALLSRPRLQYNDRGLSYVQGDITVQVIQSLATPITYPPNYSQGTPYWGLRLRITVPYRTQYRMNVAGD